MNNRVEQALDKPADSVELRELVAEMTSSELHEYVRRYNWDDGCSPMRWVVEHKECDLGTALTVFWLADPYLLFDGPPKPTELPETQAARALLQFLYDRIVADGFRLKCIKVNPLGEFIPNRTQLLRLQRRGVPSVLLEATPGATPAL